MSQRREWKQRERERENEKEKERQKKKKIQKNIKDHYINLIK